MIRESTSEQGAGDRRDAPHAPDQAKSQGPLSKRQGICQDDDRAREQARRPHAGDRSADDESGRAGGNCTHQAADFKDEHGHEVDEFDTETVVQLAIQRLQGRGREEV